MEFEGHAVDITGHRDGERAGGAVVMNWHAEVRVTAPVDFDRVLELEGADELINVIVVGGFEFDEEVVTHRTNLICRER